MHIEYFENYLRKVKGKSENTVYNYLRGVRYIDNYLLQRGISDKKIFKMTEIEELERIRNYLQDDQEFQKINSKGHRMYSAGLNSYYNFVVGDGFKLDEERKIENIYDYALPRGEMIEHQNRCWKRTSILKEQVIRQANYKCQINASHSSFISGTTNKPYMEGHHIIPLSRQEQFEYSLDIHANILCLCPNCHRMLHFGLEGERRTILSKVFKHRMKRLEKCGIVLSENEFLNIR